MRYTNLLCMLAALGVGLAHSGAAVGKQWETPSMTFEAFDLDRVRLLDGPCLEAQEANRRYLHDLDADRLLYTFRTNAGFEAPGEPLGGWEAPDGELRGHFVGHYLSACALMYASAGDTALKEKADAMVAELARVQQALGGGYLSAYPEDFWDRLESSDKPPWAPYYTMHKIMAGLYDMYALCGNQQAVEVFKGMVAYFKRRIDKLSIPQWDKVLGVEFGGVAEAAYNLYSVTGDPEHLAFAHAFDRASFLGPLALEHDNLSHIHANTHIPEILGAARRYELLGDERYRTVATYFWDRVVDARMYATGGTSDVEHWPEPNKLAKTLSVYNQESCTGHNMLKVTRHLIEWTGDPAYADYYERTYFNSVLGVQHPETGMLTYFLPLAAGNAKTYGTPNDSFWCCYGTGIESFAKLGDSIYFHDDEGIYVNLYVASEVDWIERRVRLEQRTRFAEEDTARFIVHAEAATEFTLNLHVPYWADQGCEVRVNGEALALEAEAASYLRISRAWSEGDTVEVRIPMKLHVHPMPDDPDLVSVLYGPLVLAGLCERDRLMLGDVADPASWIERVGEAPLRFRTKGQAEDTDFIPLNRVAEEHYGVYFHVAPDGSPRHQEYLRREAERKKVEQRTVDRVIPADKEIEPAHAFKGEESHCGMFQGRAWRDAQGWWSWDLKVLPDVPMTLRCTYWGEDVPPRTFDVLVGDTVIATQSLAKNAPGAFFDVEYPIPGELTQGKSSVTVTFRAHEGNTAGGIFECLALKPE